MIDLEQLKSIINNGENIRVEFKEKLENNESIAQEIIALANTEGGIILFGVGDDKTIVGITEVKQLEEKIANIVTQNLNPPLSYDWSAQEIDNKMIGILEIEKSQDRGFYSYDMRTVKEASIEDINKEKVNQFLHRVYQQDLYSTSLPLQNLLINLHILKKINSQVHPTVSGLVFFGKNPAQFVHSVGIKLAKFQGNEVSDQILNEKTIEKTIPEIIQEAIIFIKENIKHETRVQGIETKTIPQFPDIALREIIINAVAHRNYSIQSKIRVFIFDNRLEVYSPGRLPNTVTLENLEFSHYPRNFLIFSWLSQIKLVDDFGTGILKIKKAMREHNHTEPIFEIIDETFKVTLKSAS